MKVTQEKAMPCLRVIPHSPPQVPTVREHMLAALKAYFNQLEGHEPIALYRMVHEEIDFALLVVTMREAGNNKTKAARLLGITRSKKKKKLQRYGLNK